MKKCYLKLISGIDNDNEEISNQEEFSAVSTLMSDQEVDDPQQGWLMLPLTGANSYFCCCIPKDHYDEALKGQVLDQGTTSELLSDLEELGQG